MRPAPRSLAVLMLALVIALAGCTRPDAQESGENPDGATNDSVNDGRPPVNMTVNGEAPAGNGSSYTAAVTRADASVLADVNVTRDGNEDAEGPVHVTLRIVDPNGNVLLSRVVDVYPGQSVPARTEASLSGLTNWWNAHPDAEWAPVTLDIVPERGNVHANGFYGIPG